MLLAIFGENLINKLKHMTSSKVKMALKKEELPFQDISLRKISAWDELMKASALSSNPNFSPWYIQALSHHCQVFVTMVWEQEKLLAVLPYHKASNGQKTGVAIGVSDYQGPICATNTELNTIELCQILELDEVAFTHIPMDFISKNKAQGIEISPSYQISLSGGLHSYLDHLSQRGSSLWKQMEYKIRKIEKQLGEITFITFLKSPALLDTLISWKRDQFQRTGAYDDFTLPWNEPFMHSLLKVKHGSCSGMLSGLFFKGEPLALEMATCSHKTLQTCYGAYNRDYARYSPGSILLFMLLKHCLSVGISTVDLGSGEEPYKKHWFTHVNLVAETGQGSWS